jgi:hypothetical protein
MMTAISSKMQWCASVAIPGIQAFAFRDQSLYLPGITMGSSGQNTFIP